MFLQCNLWDEWIKARWLFILSSTTPIVIICCVAWRVHCNRRLMDGRRHLLDGQVMDMAFWIYRLSWIHLGGSNGVSKPPTSEITSSLVIIDYRSWIDMAACKTRSSKYTIQTLHAVSIRRQSSIGNAILSRSLRFQFGPFDKCRDYYNLNFFWNSSSCISSSSWFPPFQHSPMSNQSIRLYCWANKGVSLLPINSSGFISSVQAPANRILLF